MKPSPTTTNVCTVIAAAMILLLDHRDARADFFKYKDDKGSIVITNKLEDVPLKYRKRVKVVWDKDLEARDPLARKWAAAEAQREQQQRQQVKQQENSGVAGRKQPGDGKTLVITLDESTGQLIRAYE
jgi:hypothetical protein